MESQKRLEGEPATVKPKGWKQWRHGCEPKHIIERTLEVSPFLQVRGSNGSGRVTDTQCCGVASHHTRYQLVTTAYVAKRREGTSQFEEEIFKYLQNQTEVGINGRPAILTSF